MTRCLQKWKLSTNNPSKFLFLVNFHFTIMCWLFWIIRKFRKNENHRKNRTQPIRVQHSNIWIYHRIWLLPAKIISQCRDLFRASERLWPYAPLHTCLDIIKRDIYVTISLFCKVAFHLMVLQVYFSNF